MHRKLYGNRSIGVDELSWKVGQKYLTLVYPIDNHCRRLLWIGRDRTAETFNGFFVWLGEERRQRLEFVISDMWRAYVATVAKRANAAIHVLDCFHVMRLFNEAIDQVRRDEARRLRAAGDEVTLKLTRWVLLKRKENLSNQQFRRLKELKKANTDTLAGYLLKERFQDFWGYQSTIWASKFLDHWINEAVSTGLEPFRRRAKTLRDHRTLLLNWCRAREEFAAGAVEGFNLKARVTTRMAYGFGSYDHAAVALYHRLGNLLEHEYLTHKFT
jgi:transposase